MVKFASSIWPNPNPQTPLVVLVSGGLDSAVLLAEALDVYPTVIPMFVRTGTTWEGLERLHLIRFLTTLDAPNLRPLITLEQPVADLYGRHWSMTGQSVPGYDSPDDAVYLPGRNVLLLAKPLVWCAMNGVPELATAPLTGNPFSDATAEFYANYAALVSRATAGSVRVLRPYAEAGFHKPDVIRRGAQLPLQHTFSCLAPVGGNPCGCCNKCAERRAGFAAADVPDPTEYAELLPR